MLLLAKSYKGFLTSVSLTPVAPAWRVMVGCACPGRVPYCICAWLGVLRACGPNILLTRPEENSMFRRIQSKQRQTSWCGQADSQKAPSGECMSSLTGKLWSVCAMVMCGTTCAGLPLIGHIVCRAHTMGRRGRWLGRWAAIIMFGQCILAATPPSVLFRDNTSSCTILFLLCFLRLILPRFRFQLLPLTHF